MSVGDLDERPDLLRRDFASRIQAPGRERCEAIIFIGARTDSFYLATFLDFCSKKVADYAMAYCV